MFVVVLYDRPYTASADLVSLTRGKSWGVISRTQIRYLNYLVEESSSLPRYSPEYDLESKAPVHHDSQPGITTYRSPSLRYSKPGIIDRLRVRNPNWFWMVDILLITYLLGNLA